MGVSICAKEHGCEMGYAGFRRFRELVARQVGEHIYLHYAAVCDSLIPEDEYDAKTEAFIERNELTVGVANFLYQADCGGSISSAEASEIYSLIKDCDDEIPLGPVREKGQSNLANLKRIFAEGTEVNWH